MPNLGEPLLAETPRVSARRWGVAIATVVGAFLGLAALRGGGLAVGAGRLREAAPEHAAQNAGTNADVSGALTQATLDLASSCPQLSAPAGLNWMLVCVTDDDCLSFASPNSHCGEGACECDEGYCSYTDGPAANRPSVYLCRTPKEHKGILAKQVKGAMKTNDPDKITNDPEKIVQACAKAEAANVVLDIETTNACGTAKVKEMIKTNDAQKIAEACAQAASDNAVLDSDAQQACGENATFAVMLAAAALVSFPVFIFYNLLKREETVAAALKSFPETVAAALKSFPETVAAALKSFPETVTAALKSFRGFIFHNCLKREETVSPEHRKSEVPEVGAAVHCLCGHIFAANLDFCPMCRQKADKKMMFGKEVKVAAKPASWW